MMTITDAVGQVRQCVQDMHGYVPGKQPGTGTYIKLNTNENPYAPSPKVLAALHEGITNELGRYSDPVATALRQTAADLYGCTLDEVIAGNGTDDIFTLIFRTFLNADDVCATAAPSYSVYDALGAIQDTTFLSIPMGPNYTLPVDLDDHKAKVLLIVNPNAPTGVLFERQALQQLLETTQSIVVIDEAYADFSGETAIDMLSAFPNLIVTRTFSKAYALAGMRIGLGFAHPQIIEQMMKVKDSYNLDQLAIIASCAALEDQDWLRTTTAKIIKTRTYVLDKLVEMGLHVPPSRSNYVFPRIPDGRALEVYEGLEKRHILVRYFGNKPLVADSIRVSVGTDDEMETFLQVLRELL